MSPPLLRTLAAGAVLAPGLLGAQPISLGPLPGATGLSAPVDLVTAGDGSERLFIVQQGGQVLVYEDGQVLGTPFLSIGSLVVSGGEQGLLGLAFHPNYPATPYFFVDYTCRVAAAQPECQNSGDTIVARYQVSANPDVADPASRRVLLSVHQPFSNHNAGDLKFGPDGNLWIPLGDGGSGNDPSCNAQRDDALLGKLLRIDVNQNVNTPPYYGIPAGNPYVGPGDPADEVFARGFRNPFRFSFDRQTGDMFIGDVGQSAREEVDFVPAGTGAAANYGWKIMEGTLCTGNTGGCPGGVPACGSPAFTGPILEYDHSAGDCAIIGGYRYHGSGNPSLAGRYLYSDNCTGTIRAGTEGPPGTWTDSVLLPTGPPISAFGEDEQGELYVTTLDGTAYRILPDAPPSLSVNDVSIVEGDSGTTNAVFTVSLDYSAGQVVSVQYATGGGTATPGLDYTALSGTLTFSPTATSRSVAVPVLGDVLDEDDETFFLTLSAPVNAGLGDPQGQASIQDDDPLPALSVAPCFSLEGDSGTRPCDLGVELAPASGRDVSVSYQTASGSATSGADFLPAMGSVSFAPGETRQVVGVAVVGDTAPEPDEDFSLGLSGAVNASVAGPGAGTILDDDAPGQSPAELGHGSSLVADLAGGVPDLYRIFQARRSSYEVVLDGASGDVAPGLQLERVGADGATVLQSAAGPGSALSLRWRNPGDPVANQRVRVSAACTPSCGPQDVYRLRTYETTARIPRFNNSASQVTAVVVQNPGAAAVSGELDFRDPAGTELWSQPFSLAPGATYVFNSASVPALQGRSGSISIFHDAPYGALGGKAVALEPATGFSFDSPLEWRPR